jgi:hypothetical protein
MGGIVKFLAGGFVGAVVGFLISPKRAQKVREALFSADSREALPGLSPGTPAITAVEEAMPPPAAETSQADFPPVSEASAPEPSAPAGGPGLEVDRPPLPPVPPAPPEPPIGAPLWRDSALGEVAEAGAITAEPGTPEPEPAAYEAEPSVEAPEPEPASEEPEPQVHEPAPEVYEPAPEVDEPAHEVDESAVEVHGRDETQAPVAASDESTAEPETAAAEAPAAADEEQEPSVAAQPEGMIEKPGPAEQVAAADEETASVVAEAGEAGIAWEAAPEIETVVEDFQEVEQAPTHEEAHIGQPAPDTPELPAVHAPTDLKARIEETRRRIQRELDRPFAASGEQTPAPGGAEPSVAETLPAEERAEAVDAPTVPMRDDEAAGEPPAAAHDNGQRADLEAPQNGQSKGAEADILGDFDHDAMRRRIEETRDRLKAKAFDAMMNGESALLREGSADTADSPTVRVDTEVEETIEQALTEDDS